MHPQKYIDPGSPTLRLRKTINENTTVISNSGPTPALHEQNVR